jgi:hypothetical protein
MSPIVSFASLGMTLDSTINNTHVLSVDLWLVYFKSVPPLYSAPRPVAGRMRTESGKASLDLVSRKCRPHPSGDDAPKNCKLGARGRQEAPGFAPQNNMAGPVIFKTNYACEQRKSSAVSGGVQSVISPRDYLTAEARP